MSQQESAPVPPTGLYVNPVGQRRADFQHACAALFDGLRVADGAEQAAAMLAQGPSAVLVLDLERFELGIDLPALGELVASRNGAPVLVLCPFTNARWLPALMQHGPLDYVIGPLPADETRRQVEARLQAGFEAPLEPTAAEAELAALLAVRTEAQAALQEADDGIRFAERLCAALLRWPGLVHAAVFGLHEGGDLRLDAQHGKPGLDLAAVLQRRERLLQSPLRHAFPGLLAASSGEAALLDALDKAGEPALAAVLREQGVQMVLGLPIPAPGPGAPRGALCLLFDHARPFSRAQLTACDDLAQLAAFGLRMADLMRESEELLGRVTHLATTDALTNVANRRHGEYLMEQEIKRARRYRLPLALIAFDIDRFRAINDSFGHPVGDMALRVVADTARSLLRSSDVLVRSGGEEFQVIAPHTSAIDGLKMAEKLRAAIEAAEIPGCDHVTVSLGVAQLGETESGDSLAVRVNAALARAKRAGRNCVELAMQ
ncbi:GGDEF domain-containing protein [Telluria aromaticivorans]|uniref:diguanylate cyclase n=1 Tax=Telluria aromaticivorans TaxID=2725995 RepID=A0A7Y2JZ99_9BURK|nr:GGDEF domain-containing protein [Telluria aromaticivorans]NNG23275.1 GGDEF domain-containing protein [Telluria aromaticivorans]